MMQSLRSGLDEARKEVQAKPIRAQLVQVGAQFAGEVEFDGVAWVGRRYGKDYPDGATVASEAEAYAFVIGAV
ncbi:hypothetical protein [Roseateles sp. DB2]|uniref:hypothetical protein n=1 Tax=Roseateles sp. DB2 TaxID=3453717 RepID=UPI003F7277E3